MLRPLPKGDTTKLGHLLFHEPATFGRPNGVLRVQTELDRRSAGQFDEEPFAAKVNVRRLGAPGKHFLLRVLNLQHGDAQFLAPFMYSRHT